MKPGVAFCPVTSFKAGRQISHRVGMVKGGQAKIFMRLGIRYKILRLLRPAHFQFHHFIQLKSAEIPNFKATLINLLIHGIYN